MIIISSYYSKNIKNFNTYLYFNSFEQHYNDNMLRCKQLKLKCQFLKSKHDDLSSSLDELNIFNSILDTSLRECYENNICSNIAQCISKCKKRLSAFELKLSVFKKNDK